MQPLARLLRHCIAQLALPLALSFPLGTAHAAPPEPVKIGVIGPFSGPSSDFGKPMLQGIELAIDEINAVGGYLGRPLTLVIKDDEGKPDAGLRGAQELMRERVVATLGFCNTGVAVKAIPVFQQAQSPLIVPCAAGAPVTTQFPTPESYVFRNAPSDAIQAPFVVNDLVRRGWTRVAIFADNTAYGEAGLQSVQAALASHRLKPAHVVRFDLGVKDLSDALRQARDAGANVIFSYTVGPENATIAKGRQAIKWDVPQVGGWPLSFPFFIQGAKSATEGALMAQSFIAEPSNERRAAFLSAFARKHQQTMSVPMAAVQGYDATYLLAYALFSLRNGKFEGPAIKAALENLPRTYYGVVATYDKPFGPDDKDAISANMLVMGMVRDGKVTFAYPEDAKRNLMVQRKPRP